jgi:hypothetical protein
MDNLELYNKLRSVPEEAKREISAGRLKGFTDINPMWRIKALTETFGPCGIGWWYEITDKRMEGSGEEIRSFVDIKLYYRWNGEISQPVPGTGGASFLTKERNGAYTSDECYKMALTDAISVSAKSLGVGADVYYDKDRDKYTSEETDYSKAKMEREKKEKLDRFYNDQVMVRLHNDGDGDYALCEDCGARITERKKKDGTVMTVHDFVFNSLKEYGKALCLNCIRKANAP